MQKLNTNQQSRQIKIQQNKTTLVQSPLTTRPGNEVGLFYNDNTHGPRNPHGAMLLVGRHEGHMLCKKPAATVSLQSFSCGAAIIFKLQSSLVSHNTYIPATTVHHIKLCASDSLATNNAM